MDETQSPSPEELRKLDVASLAKQSREAWNKAKSQIPQQVRQELEPHFEVLTDSSYISEQLEIAGGTSR